MFYHAIDSIGTMRSTPLVDRIQMESNRYKKTGATQLFHRPIVREQRLIVGIVSLLRRSKNEESSLEAWNMSEWKRTDDSEACTS